MHFPQRAGFNVPQRAGPLIYLFDMDVFPLIFCLFLLLDLSPMQHNQAVKQQFENQRTCMANLLHTKLKKDREHNWQ